MECRFVEDLGDGRTRPLTNFTTIGLPSLDCKPPPEFGLEPLPIEPRAGGKLMAGRWLRMLGAVSIFFLAFGLLAPLLAGCAAGAVKQMAACADACENGPHHMTIEMGKLRCQCAGIVK